MVFDGIRASPRPTADEDGTALLLGIALCVLIGGIAYAFLTSRESAPDVPTLVVAEAPRDHVMPATSSVPAPSPPLATLQTPAASDHKSEAISLDRVRVRPLLPTTNSFAQVSAGREKASFRSRFAK